MSDPFFIIVEADWIALDLEVTIDSEPIKKIVYQVGSGPKSFLLEVLDESEIWTSEFSLTSLSLDDQLFDEKSFKDC